MSHTFTDSDLTELDRIWPLGRKLVVPDEESIVVAGAYEGRYMHFLGQLFPAAKLWGFEPQPDAAEKAKSKINSNGKATVFCSALGTANRIVSLYSFGTDGASLVSTSGGDRMVTMVDTVEKLQLVSPVGLLVLNMEGYEHALIPYLLDEMMHHRIASMAIQFHPKYVSDKRRDYVLDYLDQYYDRTYWDYPSWTYWVRKK